MKRLVDLVKLDRLDNLIRREATGTPAELAEKLKISRSNLFEFISFLKYEMSAPIHYSKEKASYIYVYSKILSGIRERQNSNSRNVQYNQE